MLDGLPRHARFLIGISYLWPFVWSWGFWAHELMSPVWIGPRHTNFYDGSICAFEFADETWIFGQPLVKLMDLYTVWALRHLHLEVVGTWPGQQVAHYAIERLSEQRDTELCGCGGMQTYGECCKSNDESKIEVADAVQFAWFPRTPPLSVYSVVIDGAEPPELKELCT